MGRPHKAGDDDLLREFRVAVPEQNIRSYTAMLRQRNCASFFL